MSERPTKTASESDDFSDLPDESNAVFETADFNKTATSSSHHDSEYDTASDTPSSEADELNDDDDDNFEDDDEEGQENESENGEEGSIVLDLERQRGDGEEQDEKKKVDDDEDRSNPQYIPKRGIFYEHDDRTADEPQGDRNDSSEEEKAEESSPAPKKPQKKSAAADRWSHDRYDECEQAPKSRAELVNSYGYDIRNEDGPPRARRRRRYGRGPNKYTRKWEDESAYAKIMLPVQLQRNPRPEDFPELGTKNSKRNSFREEKENKNEDSSSNRRHSYRSPTRRSQFDRFEGNPLQTEKYDNNQSNSDKFDGNRSQYSKQEKNRPQNDRFDGNRSQNDRFDNNRSQNDRFEGNRPQNDRYADAERYDGSRQQNDRFEVNRSQNDRYDNTRSRNDKFEVHRSQVDRFDGNRGGQNDRYDGNQSQNIDKGDRGNWERKKNRISGGGGGGGGSGGSGGSNGGSNGGSGSSGSGGGSGGITGFRTGKLLNTIEFKNQNRNKSQDSTNISNVMSSSSSKNYNSGSVFNPPRTQFEYDDKQHVESISFTNTKLTATGNLNERFSSGMEYSQNRKNVKENNRPTERPITGRQQIPSRISSTSMNPPNTLQLTSTIHNSPTIAHLPQQYHQQQSSPPQHIPQQSSANMMSNEASRSTKRYSTLRQRTNVEATQNQLQSQTVTALSMHEQQQMMLQDAALLNQLQQSQDQLQLAPNLAHPTPPASYPQTIPLQLQTEYSGQMTSSQPPPPQQPQQLILSQQPTQTSTTSGQYQTAYYAPSEFTASTVPATQSLPQAPSSSQLIPGQPYPAQYTQPAAPYIQAPPPASYIQQPNTQQQLMNYVPTIPPAQAQQQFQPVPTFPSYQNVPNYNSVSSGITYYAPQTQPPPRPILPQRRPTNAIPILAPPERSNGKGRARANNAPYDEFDDDTKNPSLNAPIGSPENIDHILDNMFVQRAPYQPPTRKSTSPSPEMTKNTIMTDIDHHSVSISSMTSPPVSIVPFDTSGGQIDYVDKGLAKISLNEEMPATILPHDSAHYVLHKPEVSDQTS